MRTARVCYAIIRELSSHAFKRYATEGPDAVRALREAGVGTVYLAGAEKGFPADATDRPDGYLATGIDAVAALTTLLDQLGVK